MPRNPRMAKLSTSSTLPTGADWAIPCVFGRDRQGRPYPPHPTQQRVFDWVLDRLAQPTGGVPALYVQHGVRSGGTRAMLNVVLARLTHEPGLRVLIGRKDFKDLRTSILETFLDILPPALLVERDAQEHRYVLRAGTTGTSTVFFRELKDLAGLGSQEFGCILVCEAHEISLAAYRTLKQRCAQQPHPPLLLLEGNAPLERHWLATVSDPPSPPSPPPGGPPPRGRPPAPPRGAPPPRPTPTSFGCAGPPAARKKKRSWIDVVV